MGLAVNDNIYLYSATRLQDILAEILSMRPRAVIVDSIQTVYLDDVNGSAGSVSQVSRRDAACYFALQLTICCCAHQPACCCPLICSSPCCLVPIVLLTTLPFLPFVLPINLLNAAYCSVHHPACWGLLLPVIPLPQQDYI